MPRTSNNGSVNWYWVILVALNIPVFVFIWRKLFGDFEDFLECVRFWLTPDWISALQGEWSEDFWAELKLFGYLILCAGAVLGEHVALLKLGIAR